MMSNAFFKHEEIYRGVDVIKKFKSPRITICGAGAIGSLLTDNLVRQGFQTLTVIDYDRVESHNINNQLYTQNDVGRKKVEALAYKIYETANVSIDTVDKKIEEHNINKIKNADLIVDAFDNIASRRLISDNAKKKNIECLHAGVNIDMGEVVWNDNYVLPEQNKVSEVDACEYPLARNTVVAIVLATTEVIIRYITLGKKTSVVFTLNDLKYTIGV